MTHDKERPQAPRQGLLCWGRPVRERRTPANMGNQPHRDNGEGVAQSLPLTHLLVLALLTQGSSFLATLGFKTQSLRDWHMLKI